MTNVLSGGAVGFLLAVAVVLLALASSFLVIWPSPLRDAGGFVLVVF